MGRRKRGLQGRIVGGSEAVPKSFPWQLFIRITNHLVDPPESFRCGGAILNKKFGLSAMHCFWNKVNLDNPGRVRRIRVRHILAFTYRLMLTFFHTTLGYNCGSKYSRRMH